MMIATIAFTLCSPDAPLLLVPVMIDGRGPFSFVLDTGASQTGVSTALAARLGLMPTARVEGASATTPLSVETGRVGWLAVGAARQDQLEVMVIDLEFLNGVVKRELDGIIGYNFLRHYIVTIDYSAATLALASSPASDLASVPAS